MSKQPKDDANVAIPVLSLKPGGGQQLTSSGTSARSSAFSKTTRVITVYAEEDIFVEIGDSTVTANQSTSHYILGQFLMIYLLGQTLMSVKIDFWQ